MTEPIQPTPARAWTQAHVYELPSGHLARLKQPALLALIGTGAGNPISDAALLKMRGGSQVPDLRSDTEKLQSIKDNSKVYLEAAALAFVEPRLVLDHAPDYDAGEIGPSDISDRDLLFVYWNFVMGVAADVAEFRRA